ncbi:hypothetical protein KIL84_004995, partial [Mauremys mutica]
MAAENPLESLQEEAPRPICLQYFTEAVTAVQAETVQRRNVRPNRQLGNMVEIANWLSFQAAKGAGGNR